MDQWRLQNDPTQLQEAAIKRAEARKRQKGGAKLAKANDEASKQLAKQVGEVMKKMGGYPSYNYVQRRNRETATPQPLTIALARVLHINPHFT